MQFDFLEKLQEVAQKTIEESKVKIANADINKTEIDLAQKLNAIQEFSVDRFEENIVVLENRENGETIQIEKNKLPETIKEGDILKCINGKYSLDKERTEEERERIHMKIT